MKEVNTSIVKKYVSEASGKEKVNTALALTNVALAVSTLVPAVNTFATSANGGKVREALLSTLLGFVFASNAVSMAKVAVEEKKSREPVINIRARKKTSNPNK